MAASSLYQLTWTLLLLCATSGRPSTASQAEEVPEPFNLTVNSFNLNTTLHWHYHTMEMTTYFTVAILNKVELEWMNIEDCQNISHHYCDLSHEIIDPLSYYKVSVQALVGSKTSRPVPKEFSLSNDGIIGPPELDVYIKEKMIIIEIVHPELPPFDEIISIMEKYPFHYTVYCGNDTEEATICDDEACTAKFPISHYGIYCFSAQAKSDYFIGIAMEKSKETCIKVVEEYSTQTIGIIVGVTVGVFAILAISCFVIARWTKARAQMPASLSTILRNIRSYVHMPAPQMPRYDNVATSPIESPVEEKNIEEKVIIDTDASTGFVSKESVDAGYQSSLTDNEQKADENGEQSNSSSYFHTDSSSSGIDSSESPELMKDEKISAPEPETRKDVKPLPSSFGYDKPHFPKEMN